MAILRPQFPSHHLNADSMTDSHNAETPAEPLFTVAEVEQLSDDDVTAGRAIGKMLSALFLYTVLAMTLVTWWTFRSISSDSSGAPAETVEQAH